MVWDAHMMSSVWCKCHCRETKARLRVAWQLFSPLHIALMLSSRSGPCGPDWLILLIYISIKSIIFPMQGLCGVMECGRIWLLVSGGESFQLAIFVKQNCVGMQSVKYAHVCRRNTTLNAQFPDERCAGYDPNHVSVERTRAEFRAAAESGSRQIDLSISYAIWALLQQGWTSWQRCIQLRNSGNDCGDAYKDGDVIHDVSAPPRLRQNREPCFREIRTRWMYCIFCRRQMGEQVRLMPCRKQGIGLTIAVVMERWEEAMILLTVGLTIPLLCGITFFCWTTCHWGWRTDPSNPLCFKGSFSTVLPDSSHRKLWPL